MEIEVVIPDASASERHDDSGEPSSVTALNIGQRATWEIYALNPAVRSPEGLTRYALMTDQVPASAPHTVVSGYVRACEPLHSAAPAPGGPSASAGLRVRFDTEEGSRLPRTLQAEQALGDKRISRRSALQQAAPEQAWSPSSEFVQSAERVRGSDPIASALRRVVAAADADYRDVAQIVPNLEGTAASIQPMRPLTATVKWAYDGSSIGVQVSQGTWQLPASDESVRALVELIQAAAAGNVRVVSDGNSGELTTIVTTATRQWRDLSGEAVPEGSGTAEQVRFRPWAV